MLSIIMVTPSRRCMEHLKPSTATARRAHFPLSLSQEGGGSRKNFDMYFQINDAMQGSFQCIPVIDSGILHERCDAINRLGTPSLFCLPVFG